MIIKCKIWKIIFNVLKYCLFTPLLDVWINPIFKKIIHTRTGLIHFSSTALFFKFVVVVVMVDTGWYLINANVSAKEVYICEMATENLDQCHTHMWSHFLL